MMDKKRHMKQGILAVSFGTTHPRTRKTCIQGVEDRIAAAFPDWRVRRAFSSRMVIRGIEKKEGISIDTPEEGLERMKREGFRKVIVQPLHILPGEEYEKICKGIEKFQNGSFQTLLIGKPLLYQQEDYQRTVEALKTQLPPMAPGEKVVLMGHGTRHQADIAYSRLQDVLDQNKIAANIATVEGDIQLEDIIPVLKKESIQRVILMPFMLVAGDHAVNDMAGWQEDSWKRILENQGFDVEICLQGLGENPAFQEIFVQHVTACMKADRTMRKRRLTAPREQIEWYPTVNRELCNGCRTCFEFCPKGVYSWDCEQDKAQVTYPYRCVVLCKGCEPKCPGGAISFPKREDFEKFVEYDE